MAEFVHVRKFGNYVLAEIIEDKTVNDRTIHTLKIKKIYSGDTYEIGQNLSISEHELKYYRKDVK